MAKGRPRKYPIPHVGQEFGLWVVLTVVTQNRSRHNECLCRCKCGVEKPVREKNLTRGLSKSCGCEIAKNTGNRFRKHGESRGGKSPEYTAWRGMVARCTNENNKRYDDYGGRGIVVCDRWLGESGYQNFLSDVGRRPSRAHSLDRVDNDGPYAPSNCRWAVRQEQGRNKRNNRLLTAGDLTCCLAEWAELLGIDARVIQALVKRGVTMEQLVDMIRVVDNR